MALTSQLGGRDRSSASPNGVCGPLPVSGIELDATEDGSLCGAMLFPLLDDCILEGVYEDLEASTNEKSRDKRVVVAAVAPSNPVKYEKDSEVDVDADCIWLRLYGESNGRSTPSAPLEGRADDSEVHWEDCATRGVTSEKK